MAFKYQKNGLNHSPDWYEERPTQEPRGGVIIGALKKDMALVGENYDSAMTFTENVGRYREYFDAAKKGEVLNGKRYDQVTNLCYDVIERELMEGFRPEDQFKSEPFNTISDLMTKHNINADTMRHFLKWRSHQVGIQKRQPTKTQQDERQRTAEILRRFKGKKPIPEFFGYENEEPKLPAVEPEPPEQP